MNPTSCKKKGRMSFTASSRDLRRKRTLSRKWSFLVEVISFRREQYERELE